MASRITYTLLIIIFASYLSSCGESDSGPVSQTPTFLKVGTRYSYFYDDDFFNTDSIITEIVDQLAPDTFLVKNRSESIGVYPTQYWVLHKNEFSTSFRLRDKSNYVTECKFGKPVGTTWSEKVAGISYTYSIAAINFAIITGWGEVSDAVKVKKVGNSQTVYQYFSPTFGPLGTGSVDDDAAVMKLYFQQPGASSTTSNSIPPISYGNFPFMTVGKYWDYKDTDLFGNETTITLLIESKLADKNVYKIKLSTDGSSSSYSFWYEDRGYLMSYEDGEEIEEADPIYMEESKAVMGDGWTGVSEDGTTYLYTIEGLNEPISTYFGNLSCMAIYVSDGFFTAQTNYWNQNKGNVLVTGFSDREVTDSNARKRKTMPLIMMP